MSVKVIGLAGPGCVGKSTTAKGLVEAFNRLFPILKVDRMAFADPIYNTANYLTGIPVDILKSQDYKEVEWEEDDSPMPCLVGWTPRKFLQIVGTECFRNNVSDNFWVESAIRQATVRGLDIVIMEDSRFQNEFEMADINIELKRDGIEYACNHASAMPPEDKFIDFVIELYPDISFDTYVDKIHGLLGE